MQQQSSTSVVGYSPISPSFNSYSTSSDETLAEIAVRVVQELSSSSSALDFYSWEEEEEETETTPDHEQSSEDEEEEEGEFEFAIASREAVTSPISADEIFYNGQIRPLYPLFNTDLLLNDPEFNPYDSNFDSKPKPPPPVVAKPRRPQLKKLFREEGRDGCDGDGANLSEEELESLPEGTYCVWKPKKEGGGGVKEASPEIRKKSKSTGTDSKRWKFRDLLYRSKSDGKDSFVFLAPIENAKKAATAEGDKMKGGEKKRYAKKEEKVLTKEGEKRRSFLPYRQDVVGLFSNVSGVSRNLHPF